MRGYYKHPVTGWGWYDTPASAWGPFVVKGFSVTPGEYVRRVVSVDEYGTGMVMLRVESTPQSKPELKPEPEPTPTPKPVPVRMRLTRYDEGFEPWRGRTPTATYYVLSGTPPRDIDTGEVERLRENLSAVRAERDGLAAKCGSQHEQIRHLESRLRDRVSIAEKACRERDAAARELIRTAGKLDAALYELRSIKSRAERAME